MAEPNRIMKRQTRVTAHAPVEPRTQYLAFGLGSETFAFPIGAVKEVIQFAELVEVPLMASFVRGVINLRGAVVPVIDLAIRFRRPATEVVRRTCIVILEVLHGAAPVVLGVIVDSVREVLELAASEVEPAPAFGDDDRRGFVQGVGRIPGGFVILLDVNQLLTQAEFGSLAAATEDLPS
jgi:purine-binding chemotaxis protein CheW